ncbi:Fructosamine kinase-domain-containing protein [Apiospora kogelbergensis]|uniref:Fructosamine kinase-domain-containing protein n=1 Tax=Apiospora kogelbergensis TaxID=1337665 RepID=UPI00313256FD
MDEELDPAILAALPEGCVTAVNPHGKGSWSSGYKVDVEANGEEHKFFSRPRHAEMALGEYESQKELQKYLPDNVIVPIAQGQCQLDSSASFFLARFRDLDEKVAQPSQLVEVLERLHRLSTSPNGKFGFHVATFNGWAPLVNEWCDTWEEYFTRQFRSDIAWMSSIRSPDADFDVVVKEFFDKVVPRLLRPLQTGGRNIKPTLVHGDVWPGNIQIDMAEQRVVLFDSCCCYGHNELDLAMMREPRYQFTIEHVNKYKEVVGPSEPAEDFDDRNALYGM